MGRLGVIGGSGLLGSSWMDGAPRVDIGTERGPVGIWDTGEVVVLQRHGADGYVAASEIDHHANLLALQGADCDRILSVASTGSLHAELAVGSFLCPHDFIALHLGPSFDPLTGGRVPGFDHAWRQRIVGTWLEVAEHIHEGGVYWHAVGPRFETPAEIKLMATFADVVGMTLAPECILAGELGISYAAVCVVDNLANGIGDVALSVDDFLETMARNQPRLLAALDAVIPALAENP